MDPLSITASIVGLLAAAGKITDVLATCIRNTQDAPKLADAILQEVSDLHPALRQLQGFLGGTRAGPIRRTGLIMVEQVVATLTCCVMTFSELEETVSSLDPNPSGRLWPKMAWAKQEATLTKLLSRLQSSKSSLNLMLAALSW